MSKLIIDNQTELTDSTIILMVAEVIRMGKISGDGTQYCYHTVFYERYEVIVSLNEKSQRFLVREVENNAPTT